MLGIDPGLGVTGFSILESNKNQVRLAAYGTIKPNSKDTLPKRLNDVFPKIREKSPSLVRRSSRGRA